MFDTTDVLIAGAGPVGLMLAAELRRDGVKVRVIDAHDERVFFVKALGVTARTLEIFEDLGIVREAIDAGVWLTGADTFQDGAPAFSAEVPRGGLPYGALALAQFETERILEAALARHGGHVEYGATLADFTVSADFIDARIQDACGESRTIRCRWLVGCDGARSTVRRQLNVAYEGDQYPQTFMLADVDVEWNLPRGRMYRFNVTGEGDAGSTTLAALPVRGSARRYRLSMVLLADDAARHTLNSTPDFAEIERIMLPILPKGTRLSSMRWSSVYRVSHRIAQHYSHGRVFLAGDAAHIHPPVGGQGMNTGLQDAHNLAWKLALVARGVASEALLDSYEAERRPVGLDVVEATSRALNTVLAHGEIKPAMRETQLLVGYRGSSAIVADECADMAAELPAPGDRVPEVGGLVQAFVGHAQRLQEHLGRGRHTLVGYLDDDVDGARVATFDAAVDAWRGALGTAASAVLIVSPKLAHAASFEPAREAYRTLSDDAGAFVDAFGAKNGMAWAVRPDGHIGFRSARCAPDSLMAWLRSALHGDHVGLNVSIDRP
ncbi:3-(3-hydroxyphenyl)propionate hydroxylase [Burkholderia sp. THE68]|uniref:FAD-dependent monooxygenase n=1 Tax=Burkholderia sp. THE68 TaxID=758782 RepID=UPI001316CD06|nr:FAD-dependent monooxygenase [Burkholderia sp. THE68]BBU31733.1 3-(3-hydroxyphenyl)propionate hydroxylase [Burkholderia sp. THE68]